MWKCEEVGWREKLGNLKFGFDYDRNIGDAFTTVLPVVSKPWIHDAKCELYWLSDRLFVIFILSVVLTTLLLGFF